MIGANVILLRDSLQVIKSMNRVKEAAESPEFRPVDTDNMAANREVDFKKYLLNKQIERANIKKCRDKNLNKDSSTTWTAADLNTEYDEWDDEDYVTDNINDDRDITNS